MNNTNEQVNQNTEALGQKADKAEVDKQIEKAKEEARTQAWSDTDSRIGDLGDSKNKNENGDSQLKTVKEALDDTHNDIAGVNAKTDTNAKNIADNADMISRNKNYQDIVNEAQGERDGVQDERISANEQGIAANKNAVDSAIDRLDGKSGAFGKNSAFDTDNGIGNDGRNLSVEEAINANRKEINKQQAHNSTTDAVIGGLGQQSSEHGKQIAENTDQISKNRGDIDSNREHISAAEDILRDHDEAIKQNHDDIAGVNTKNDTNAKHISDNAKRIADNTSHIDTNSGLIAENSGKIADLNENKAGKTEMTNAVDKARRDAKGYTDDRLGDLGERTDANGGMTKNTVKDVVDAANERISRGNERINAVEKEAQDNFAEADKRLDSHEDRIKQNKTRIDGNAKNIADNAADIESNTKALVDHDGRLLEQGVRIGDNASNISKNAEQIAENSEKIADNSSRLESHDKTLSEHEKRINTNDRNISNVNKKTDRNADDILENRQGIKKNAEAIDDVNERVDDTNDRVDNLGSKGKAAYEDVSNRMAELNKRFDTNVAEVSKSYVDNSAAQTLKSANDYTDKRYNQLNGKVKKLRARADSGIAGATAIGTLAFDSLKANSIAGGLAVAKNKVAGAMGYQRNFNENWRARGTVSVSDNYVQGGASVGYSW